MGMGEPLNYSNVLKAIERITSEEHGLGMAARRITLSTVGVSKMIRKLADDRVRFNLAVSCTRRSTSADLPSCPSMMQARLKNSWIPCNIGI